MESVAGTAICPSCGQSVPAAANFCTGCGHDMASVVYAGFWIRFLAWIIDFFILLILGIVPALTVEGLAGFLLQLAVGVAYRVGFWSAKGATLGQMAVGVKITTVDGEPIDFGRALLRYIGYLASAIILLIGFLMIAFTREKRGLHDHIAGTVVIKTR